MKKIKEIHCNLVETLIKILKIFDCKGSIQGLSHSGPGKSLIQVMLMTKMKLQ